MPLATVNASADSFAPSALLSLYEIDSRFVSPLGSRMLFHAGVNGLYKSVIWNGEEYTAFPIEVTETAINGNGTPPRPKLTCSNILGVVSIILLQQGDLVGARFIRRRVFARFLDAANFANGINPFGTPDPTAGYDDEIYFINRKLQEDPNVVVFETVSAFELDNVQLPHRPMLATVCPSIYRDPETCGYSGGPLTDQFGKSFTAAPPAGYGFTLSAKGLWSNAVTYGVGDYVQIISQGDFTYGDILVYVCDTAGTLGDTNNPQFNQTNWIADACQHNILGCKTHFSVGALPIGSFAGTSRADYSAN